MNVHPKTSLREDEVHESPLLKTVCRYPAESWQMDRKTETASTVLSQYSGLSTSYKYDAKGHLVESDMFTCHEDYAYNGIGQRIFMLHTRKGVFNYTYDAQGKLTQVNDTRFQYDSLGRLSGTTAPNIPAKHFMYERVRIGELDIDRLGTFQDSTGKSYTYSYTPNNPLPVAVHSYGQPVVTYQWDESGALPRLLVCTTPLATWQFGYLPENDSHLPDTVALTGPVVAKLGYWDLKSLQCKLGYDHLGTVKLIADPFNELVKELFYDSFGNIVSETEQGIYFPLGFAGGLRDIASGFVCFGFRDYDPSVGRFTTPDPALDLRGDGDIYDYCVDDPVNRMDEEGLRFKSPQHKTNRYPGDMRKKNQYQKDKKEREKAEEEAAEKQAKDERFRKETSERDIVDPGAEARNDLEESLNAMKDGYGVGSKWFGPFGGAAGAVFALFGTKAAEKILDTARDMGIDHSDSTTISGVSHTDTYSKDKKALSQTRRPSKVISTHAGKCTPDTQPRTSDGCFASCGHVK